MFHSRMEYFSSHLRSQAMYDEQWKMPTPGFDIFWINIMLEITHFSWNNGLSNAPVCSSRWFVADALKKNKIAAIPTLKQCGDFNTFKSFGLCVQI